MAKKVTKSSFAERLAQAHEEHKGDETRVGSGGDLPPGIDQGVARLVDVKVGTFQKGDNKGQPFFMAAGTVLEPDTITVVDQKTKKSRVIHVKGLRTQIGPEPICDTTAKKTGVVTSLSDHWDRVLNHLRLLGIDTKTISPEDVIAEAENGEFSSGAVLEALLEAAPTFRFRTWQGKPSAEYPDPRVNHDWRGAFDYSENGDGDAVQDSSGEKPKWESDAEAEAGATEEEAPVEEEPETEATEEPEEDEKVDYLALAKLADAGKPKKEALAAAKTLSDHAKMLGIEGAEDMASWVEVAEAIVAEEQPEAEEEEEEPQEEEEYQEEPEEWAPSEGEVCYLSNGAKKAPTECEIVKVYGKVQKADIKRLDTKKIIKGVPFAKLGPDEIPF